MPDFIGRSHQDRVEEARAGNRLIGQAVKRENELRQQGHSEEEAKKIAWDEFHAKHEQWRKEKMEQWKSEGRFLNSLWDDGHSGGPSGGPNRFPNIR